VRVLRRRVARSSRAAYGSTSRNAVIDAECDRTEYIRAFYDHRSEQNYAERAHAFAEVHLERDAIRHHHARERQR
jgi:hypothetical protein